MSLRNILQKIFPFSSSTIDYEKLGLLNSEDEEDDGVEDVSPFDDENNDENEPTRKITTFNAFWNISNSIQGVAILAMPYVIKGGGWWSVLALSVVAMLSDYTGQILMECHYDDVTNESTGVTHRTRTRGSYAEIGNAVFPKHGKLIVLITQVLELLFMATLYPIVFVSVMNSLFSHAGLPSAVWITIFGIMMLPNVFLRKIYHISLMSSLTVASATSVFFAISIYCFTVTEKWNIDNLSEFSTNEFIASVGVVVASYSSQMYLSVIEGAMQEPKKIGRVMNAGYAAMTFLKIGIGIIAYMTFGKNTKQVVTLNLPTGFLLSGINAIVVILAMSSYSLPMFTVFEILEKDSWWFTSPDEMIEIAPTDTKEIETAKEVVANVKRTAIRLSLVLITLLMALSVPHFCLFLSFIGSFTGAFLEMIFPCCFYLSLKHESLSKATILLNVFIVIFSLFFMGTGMYFSAIEIITAFRLHTKEVWTID